MRKSLNIISENKKNLHINTNKEKKKTGLYGADLNSIVSSLKNVDLDNVSSSEDYSKSDTSDLTYTMNVYINDYTTSILRQLGGLADVSFDESTETFSNTTEIDGSEKEVSKIKYAEAWDPRLYRKDGYVTSENYVIPFASETASSAYFDHLFTVEKAILENYSTSKDKKTWQTSNKSGQNGTKTTTSTDKDSENSKASDKIAPNTTQVNELKQDARMYGTASLVNPYCVTRLIGGLSGSGGDNLETHMYDIRDTKRFYDCAGKNNGNIVETADDYTSINNPTVTNIIRFCNKDSWNRIPYSYLDFVFLKYFNIIPNNRLITFRKYAVPTYDNLNFPKMEDSEGEKIQMSPIATVVSYFGGETGNQLNSFLKFTTGTKWKEISADVHKVSGDTGSNPRAVIDSMFEKGGFGGQGSNSPIVNSFLSKTGGLTGQYLSFGKFVGLLDRDGYSGHSQEAWENLTSANVDPSEQLYANKIVGPVNRIQSVQARDAGIEFEQTFSLTVEYIARPIGGINVKAAMLDILANCMELASPEAVFWGGGYRFNIKPHMYPFKRGAGSNRIMDDLYAGRIFGTNGAIAHGLEGLLNFGQKDGSSSFEWSTVTEKLGDVLSQTVGAIGNMLQSISSSLFGSESNLTSWLKKGTDMVSSEEAQKKGTEKMNSMFSNLNKMWKDKVIKETTMPSIDGMRSILSGEPTGNWWMCVGSPLNPIMTVGNLICKKMEVTFGDELGPDDFPLNMKVVYSIEHAMPRDKAAIQSMFNRGAGKIYKLPDYIKAVSDYESRVDKFTGVELNARTNQNSFYVPKYMNAGAMQRIGGAHGYQTYKIEKGKTLLNSGNADTTVIAKFTPADPQISSPLATSIFTNDDNNVPTYTGNFYTRKRNSN